METRLPQKVPGAPGIEIVAGCTDNLVLLTGDYDLSANTCSVTERDTLLDCVGTSYGIDFELTQHNLALTCESERLRSEASAAFTDVTNSLLAARKNLVTASATEYADRLAAIVAVREARDVVADSHYQSLIHMFFGDSYHPHPPMVEPTELLGNDGRYGLLLESPEPLDWNRIGFTLKWLRHSSEYNDISSSAFIVWNEDGIRALILHMNGGTLPNGTYVRQLVLNLDVGTETPVLCRNRSTIPETAALCFILSETYLEISR